jgi:hypothetical protein
MHVAVAKALLVREMPSACLPIRCPVLRPWPCFETLVSKQRSHGPFSDSYESPRLGETSERQTANKKKSPILGPWREKERAHYWDKLHWDRLAKPEAFI